MIAHERDAIPSPHHFSYKIPGLLAWLTLGLSVVGSLAFPRAFLAYARLFASYLLVRLAANVLFYLVGVARCRAWARRRTTEAHPLGSGGSSDVHHVVIIPNYAEPIEVLSRTLQGLATQDEANHQLTVVLAMEEREADARAKARALRAQFADQFAHFLITVHPANLPDEVAGKGANQAWAARQVKRELVGRLGLPIEHLTLTSCDADSVLHPGYFATLSRLFASDPARHHRFWYAPLFYDNNIWQVPAVIRLLAFSTGAGRLGELTSPLSFRLPTSTYTLSFKLADGVGYWDPSVISEDWHMYLRCFFATRGQVALTPIFLENSADAVDGKTLWQALANYYRQEVRHAWGAQDVGYILQQWRRSPGTPFHRKLFCLCWVLHHHLLRSTSWFVIMLGSLVSGVSQNTLIITLPGQSVQATLIQVINALGLIAGVTMWAAERTRCRHLNTGSRLAALARELVAWVLLPLLTLAFKTLPGLHAQTKLLLGLPLPYHRTPKSVLRDTQARAAG